MSGKPDCQTAYETLTLAMDEAISILSRARMMVDAGLRMQKGKELENACLSAIRERNGPV